MRTVWKTHSLPAIPYAIPIGQRLLQSEPSRSTVVKLSRLVLHPSGNLSPAETALPLAITVAAISHKLERLG